MNEQVSHLDQLITDAPDLASVDQVHAPGPVSDIARRYVPELSKPEPYLPKRLLGFLLNLSYEDVTIVTCDPWKRACGGVPRNSFVFVRLSPEKVSGEEAPFCDRIIMVRITESVPTPVASEIQQTIFQIHKAQANVDPITNKEFQWSALKGKIVGTYYDKTDDGSQTTTIGFGLDVDTFFAPHCYEVYVPHPDHLKVLINAFSEDPEPLNIGYLRYTETPSSHSTDQVLVQVDPTDFIGKSYGHRTALFGKTRFGKSNTMKVIADTILQRDGAGQIIFDPSGEYTYWNGQDNGCLAVRYPNRCVRYSLRPRPMAEEQQHGLAVPSNLLINFYDYPDVGHNLIFSLWPGELGRVPDYITPAQNWEPESLSSCPPIQTDISGYNHYWRTMGIWFAILKEGGFSPRPGLNVPTAFPGTVKTALLADQTLGPLLKKDATGKVAAQQPIAVLPTLWKKIAALHDANPNQFPASSNTGEPYFNAVELGLQKILAGNVGSGAKKFTRFLPYHDPGGTNPFKEIVEQAQAGKTVFVDLSMGDERVRKALADRISSNLLASQMSKFNRNELSTFIVLYFEEAHNLFPKSDTEVGTDVYNKLAKEGAKFHISMVYATQSMSTLSPDLLKNTENFIVTHLDDDREVKELEHKRAFRDIAADVERITSKGYVRMKTLSLPFALPVQVRRFEGAPTVVGT
jgi:Helicase HerA, central domain